MDRTSLLYDTLAATQPYFDTTEGDPGPGPGSGSGSGSGSGVSVSFSRLRVLEEVKRRSSRLFSLPFHCRARDLSATIRHLSDTFTPLTQNQASGHNHNQNHIHIHKHGHGHGSSFKTNTRKSHLELAACVKQVQGKLKQLQGEVEEAGKGERGKGTGNGGGSQGHAHQAGVLLILLGDLQMLGDIQKELLAKEMKPEDTLWSRKVKVPNLRRQQGLPSAPGREEGKKDAAQVQLQEENSTLLNELQQMNDSVEQVQQTLVEISSLNQVFSSQIQEQSEQLELLYEEAMQVSMNFEKGNKELTKAKEYNKQGGRIIIIIILLATFSLLFLDWYQG